MAGLAHFGVGLAAKRFAPKAPLVLLLIAAAGVDLLFGIFYFTGVETMGSVPWSHGIFMGVVWATAVFLIVLAVFRDRKAALVFGLVFFSHTVLDFITHPMGAISGGKPVPPDMPLMFPGSPMVGLGLYNHSYALAVAFDAGFFLLGLGLYLRWLYLRRTAKKLS